MVDGQPLIDVYPELSEVIDELYSYDPLAPTPAPVVLQATDASAEWTTDETPDVELQLSTLGRVRQWLADKASTYIDLNEEYNESVRVQAEADLAEAKAAVSQKI